MDKKFFSPNEIPALAVDGRERGFFQLDDELVEDSSLTIYDRAVYMVIVKHATRTGPKASQARLLNSTIATTAGCSPRQVRASIARLKSKKQPYSGSAWISVFATKDARGQASNVYLVLPVGKKPKNQQADRAAYHAAGMAPDAGGVAYHADITRGSSNQRYEEREEIFKTATADAVAGDGRGSPFSPSKRSKKTEHPEHQACCKVVYDDFAKANPDVKLDWHKGIAAHVRKLLREIPSMTAAELDRLCRNRRSTPGIKQAELPKLYLTSITNYKNGPTDRFGKEPGVNPNAAPRNGRLSPAEKDATIIGNMSDALRSRAAGRMARQ